MMDTSKITFTENSAAKTSDGRYITIAVKVEPVLQSWRDSVFSFEWLDSAGAIKALSDLPAREQPKRNRVEEALEQGQALEQPILGIGLKDNIEIGSGRAEFLTLATKGAKTIPVHIPKSNESDFQAFRADVD